MLTAMIAAAALSTQAAPPPSLDLLPAMKECRDAMAKPVISRVEIRDKCSRALMIALVVEESTEETARTLASVVWMARPGGTYHQLEQSQGR